MSDKDFEPDESWTCGAVAQVIVPADDKPGSLVYVPPIRYIKAIQLLRDIVAYEDSFGSPMHTWKELINRAREIVK